MSNHPLNTRRYAEVVAILRGTLIRVNDYLDVAIELKKMELEDKIEEREQKVEEMNMETHRDLYIDYAAEMDMAEANEEGKLDIEAFKALEEKWTAEDSNDPSD